MKISRKQFEQAIEKATKDENWDLVESLQIQLTVLSNVGMITAPKEKRKYGDILDRHIKKMEIEYRKFMRRNKDLLDEILDHEFIDARGKRRKITRVRIYFDTKVVE